MSINSEQYLQHFRVKKFKKGESILLKDDIPDAVHLIERGKIKSYTITIDGAERQISIHSAGDDIPVGFTFGLCERSGYFYQAYTDCTIRMIPQKDYIELLRQDIELIFKRYISTSAQLMSSYARISALEHPKASDKVAFMLLSLAEQFGTRLRPYKARLNLPMTQQEMADALGLTRETTGIELRKLEVRNIISHTRKNYVLYMERLRKYIDRH